MPKHRRSVPAVKPDFGMRSGLVQLTTRAVSSLLGLAALTIAINTATGNDFPVVDPTVSSNSGPSSGIGGATLPSVTADSPMPSDTATTSDANDDTSDGTTEDPTDTVDPTPVEPTPTPTPTEPPGHGKPTDKPGKPK